jgi:AcrR family transcriptional regulator
MTSNEAAPAMTNNSTLTGAPRYDRTAAAILDAAAGVLAERGSGANMADVAATAGVSRATLYRYYPDRQALLDALATQVLTDAATRLADAGLERAPVEDAIERMLRALVPVGAGYALIAQGQVKYDPAEAERLIGAPMKAVFERGIETGFLRQDLSAEVLSTLFGGALQAAIRLAQRGEFGLEEVSAVTASLFLDGARAR